MSYGVVNSLCTQAISTEAVETSHFTDESRFTLFRPKGRHRVPTSRGKASPTLALTNGIGLGWHCAPGKITDDCCRGQCDCSKVQS